MTLEQLRIFVAVADLAHVTRAAAELGITQSAASAAIAALEARYDAKLFDRVGRGIHLTEAGRALLPHARAVLDRVVAARSVLEDRGSEATGTVGVAASQTIASYWLPARLSAFRAAHPGVTLDVVIGNTREVEAAVVDGAVNLGLVEGPTRHRALLRRQIDQDRPLLVVAANYPPLPESEPGRLDLAAIPWVIREEGSGTRHVLEELAQRAGLSMDELNIFLVLPVNEAVREAVEAGAGATIISEHVVASAVASGKLRAIPIDLPPRDFTLVRHRDRHLSVAQAALIKQLTQGARGR
ncbi:MAG TPA: LysR family transcriptional regulator [Xanthobacteraceae bacterium]|nr:LysR family transcriptional regulator [Xanthobacteraceae bacterium]